jgi:hypothetical protein
MGNRDRPKEIKKKKPKKAVPPKAAAPPREHPQWAPPPRPTQD